MWTVGLELRMASNLNSNPVLRLWQRTRSRMGVHLYGVLAALIGTVLMWALFFIPGEQPEPMVTYAWVGSAAESIAHAQALEEAQRTAAAPGPAPVQVQAQRR
jgi:hypothetical protein